MWELQDGAFSSPKAPCLVANPLVLLILTTGGFQTQKWPQEGEWGGSSPHQHPALLLMSLWKKAAPRFCSKSNLFGLPGNGVFGWRALERWPSPAPCSVLCPILRLRSGPLGWERASSSALGSSQGCFWSLGTFRAWGRATGPSGAEHWQTPLVVSQGGRWGKKK